VSTPSGATEMAVSWGRTCSNGQRGISAGNTDGVAATNLAAHGLATGKNVEVHVAGGELSGLKCLRGRDGNIAAAQRQRVRRIDRG